MAQGRAATSARPRLRHVTWGTRSAKREKKSGVKPPHSKGRAEPGPYINKRSGKGNSGVEPPHSKEPVVSLCGLQVQPAPVSFASAVADVEDSYDAAAVIDGVNDSVNVWLLAEEKVAKFSTFGENRATLGETLKVVNRFGKTIEPFERLLGGIGMNEFVNVC